jgi:type II secretory pathway pseudopilin PulG
MVELMIVVGLIGILASIAIPGYQRITARSHRSEMYTAMSKFRLYFKSLHDNTGTFSTEQTLAAGISSAVNPSSTIAPGQPAGWVTNANGWVDLPFPPEGAIRMRYWYTMGPDDVGRVHDVTLQACGSFPGFGPTTLACSAGMTGNYLYTEVFHGNGTSDVVELPDF